MEINQKRLYQFEAGLDPQKPEDSNIHASVIGYGEMSAIFQIEGDDKNVYKRLPIFSNQAEAIHYEGVYHEYSKLLIDSGLKLPDHDTAIVGAPGRPLSLYIAQKKIPGDRLCHQLIQQPDRAFSLHLIEQVVKESTKILSFNKQHAPRLKIAIDGQLSNWVHLNERGEEKLLYIDTSTPLFCKNGVEQQDPELLLKSTPGFLRWLIRLFFLEGVMTRYYDQRLVYIDLAANLYKEQQPELIPDVIKIISRYLNDSSNPVTHKEVDSYYRVDKLIWTLFLGLRRIDRFFTTKILRKRYEFILPGKINR